MSCLFATWVAAACEVEAMMFVLALLVLVVTVCVCVVRLLCSAPVVLA